MTKITSNGGEAYGYQGSYNRKWRLILLDDYTNDRCYIDDAVAKTLGIEGSSFGEDTVSIKRL